MAKHQQREIAPAPTRRQLFSLAQLERACQWLVPPAAPPPWLLFMSLCLRLGRPLLVVLVVMAVRWSAFRGSTSCSGGAQIKRRRKVDITTFASSCWRIFLPRSFACLRRRRRRSLAGWLLLPLVCGGGGGGLARWRAHSRKQGRSLGPCARTRPAGKRRSERVCASVAIAA